MGEGTGSGTRDVIIAVIGSAGVVTAALLANMDKIFPSKPAAQETQPSPVVTPPPTDVVANSAVPAPPAQVVSSPPPAPVPVSLESGAGQPAAPPVVSIAGEWQDSGGNQYLIDQRGTDYRFMQFHSGVQVGGGQGTIRGRNVNHSFSGTEASGDCAGQLQADGASIAGTCRSGMATWPFVVSR